MKILLVDDQEIVCVPICDELTDKGHQVVYEQAALPALEKIAKDAFDVVITDLKMPGMDGLELLRRVKKEYPDTAVIMITGHATVDTAVEAMREGAYDYVTKPFKTKELMIILERLAEHRALVNENRRLKTQLAERFGFHQIVGKSAAMQKVYANLDIVSKSDCTVLVTGATGTGKELVADAIHYSSTRKNGPLVKVSCAALSREVLESELFGHVAGAYTGAVRDRKGRFEQADGGTIFLDEVDDIPVDLQVKLLRVLESREFERVGDGITRKTDVRIIAATKVDLYDLVESGRFRADLFYRLNVVPIALPTLVERSEDIPLLFDHFLEQHKGAGCSISPDVMDALMAYSWPGNVRELKNLTERFVLVHPNKRVETSDLPDKIRGAIRQSALRTGSASFDDLVSSLERQLIFDAMEKTQGNKTQAAELLKMSPSKFRYKLSSYTGEN